MKVKEIIEKLSNKVVNQMQRDKIIKN